MNIDESLKSYIETTILPEYEHNIGGHDINHINFVIDRSFELMEEFSLNLNPNMVYTIASYHDIGYQKDPDNHEKVSADMFQKDKKIQEFFTPEEVKIIYEAIIDHRASLEYEARSIYGKLVSSADREISAERMLTRSFLYQQDKHAAESPSVEEIIAYSYKKLSSKYGKGGYAKMYYPDTKYQEFISTMETLTSDFKLFREKELELATTKKLIKQKQ